MAKPKPSWREKLAQSRPPEVKRLEKSGMGMQAGQLMLISSPAEIDTAIRKIPRGKTLEVPALRTQLARAACAEVTCPLTTGIFLRIVTEAANEGYEAGVSPAKLTPVWRVIDRKLPLVKKLSFDPEWMFQLREAE